MKGIRILGTPILLTALLTACGGTEPTSSEETPDVQAAPPSMLLPPDDIEPGGGGGGGGDGTGGGTGTATPQYRVVGQVYKIEAGGSWEFPTSKVRGWSRFETMSGVKVDAQQLSIQCVGGGASDQDSESGAGFTDVEFWTGPYPRGANVLVQCVHTAVHQGVTYSVTSTGIISMT